MRTDKDRGTRDREISLQKIIRIIIEQDRTVIVFFTSIKTGLTQILKPCCPVVFKLCKFRLNCCIEIQ